MAVSKSDTTLLSPLFYSMIAYSAVLGGLGGIITIAFIRAFELIQHVLWTYLPEQFGIVQYANWYVLVMCIVGGVLLGLLLKHLGEYPISLEESLVEFKKNKKFDYRHIPQAIVISLVSLGFGAALGPEAALTAIVGGLATWIGLRVKFSSQQLRSLEFSSIAGVMGGLFGTFLGSAAVPASEDKNELPKIWIYVPGIVAAACAYFAFRIASGGSSGYFNLQLLPYTFNIVDILWTIPAALAGTAVGILFINLGQKFDSIVKGFDLSTVGKATLGGLGLGLLAIATPLALFSGHEGLQTIINDYTTTGSLALITAALIKILAANICLSTGWKGGRFFPIMFAGAAVGLGITHVLPIPPMIGFAAGISAALAVLLRKPLLAALFVIFFFPPNLYLFVVAAAVLSTMMAKKLSAPRSNI